jgi:hypothetical protein
MDSICLKLAQGEDNDGDADDASADATANRGDNDDVAPTALKNGESVATKLDDRYDVRH